MTTVVKNKKEETHAETKQLIVNGYARVSSEIEVKRESSLPNQIAAIDAYVKYKGWKLKHIYVEKGISGGKGRDKRPQLDNLMNDVESDGCNVVLTTKLDRFARDVTDLFDMVKIMKDHHVTFVAPDDNIDTSPDNYIGELTMGILGVIASWERKRIGDRIAIGRQGYYNKHEFNSGNPSYGYKYITRDEWASIAHDANEPKPLMINDVEAIAVTYIYTEYTRPGHYIGYDKLAIKMNQETTYPPPHPTRAGKKRHWWTGDGLETILTNPIYKGGWGSPGWQDGDYWYAAKPIVTRDLWDLAQKTRVSNPKRPRSGIAKSKYQGHLFCSECGCGLYPDVNHGENRVWACKGSLPRTHGGDKSKLCKFPRLNLKEIDDRIDAAINDMMTNPEKLKTNLEKALAEFKIDWKNESADTSLLNEQIAQIDNQIGIAKVNSEEGMYTPDVYRDKLKKLKSDRQKLEERRQHLDPNADFDLRQKQFTIKWIQDMIINLSTWTPDDIEDFVGEAPNIANSDSMKHWLKPLPKEYQEVQKVVIAQHNLMSAIWGAQGLLNDSVIVIVHPDKQIDLNFAGKTLINPIDGVLLLQILD